jgi:Protein of unknown function (DUF2750)
VSQSASQAAVFYRDVAQTRTVWTLRDAGGYPAPKNHEGSALSPSGHRAHERERIVSTVAAYAGFDVVEVPLDTFIEKWLPGLEEDGLHVGVKWSGPRATGYDIEPGSVRASLDAALGR